MKASSDAEGLRDLTFDAATAAKNAGDAAIGFGKSAVDSGTIASDKLTEAETSKTDADTAKDAADTARDKADEHAALALYNSWGTIEDHDYNFLTYGIWGEGTSTANFPYLTA